MQDFYLKIPSVLFSVEMLSNNDRVLLALLCNMHKTYGQCCASNSWLAQQTAQSISTLKRGLLILEQIHAIIVENIAGKRIIKIKNRTLEQAQIELERFKLSQGGSNKARETEVQIEPQQVQNDPGEVQIELHEVQIEPHNIILNIILNNNLNKTNARAREAVKKVKADKKPRQKKTKAQQSSEEISPLYLDFKYLRISEKDMLSIKTRYDKLGINQELIPIACQVVEDWLGTKTRAALEARQAPTHYRSVCSDYAIEGAIKLSKASKYGKAKPKTNYEKTVALVNSIQKKGENERARVGRTNDLFSGTISENGNQRDDNKSLSRTLRGENTSGSESSNKSLREKIGQRVATEFSTDSSNVGSDSQSAATEIIQGLSERFGGAIVGRKAETN